MLPKEFKISSFMPPAISIIGGVTYVVPGWHVVPSGTLLKEVYERWTQDLPYIEERPNQKIYEIVNSSKGDKKYDVKFDGHSWSCSCAGYEFRRSCQHLTLIKEKYAKSKKSIHV